MYYVIQCRFSEFLIQLCIENAFFFRSVQKYYFHVQKIFLFLGPCRNITIQGQGVPGFPCRAIFGVREKILIFGEIYTSDMLICELLKSYLSFSLPPVLSRLQLLVVRLGWESHRLSKEWMITNVQFVRSQNAFKTSKVFYLREVLMA